jgi:hypothetical protein
MTTPLLSASQMSAIQKVGERAMQTDVTIYNHDDFLLDPADVNGDDQQSWTLWGTVKGWIAPILGGSFTEDIAWITAKGEFKLRVPAGTPVEPTDKCVIGGLEYSVVDSNVELTWPEWTTVRLERIQ